MKLLIGGSPCTHWSIAQTKNRETEASGIGWELFLNYRIARDKYQPDYFLYENNKSMSPAIRAQITAELGVEPVLINSALVSAQNRQRLYWAGKRNPDGTYRQVPVELPEDRGILLRDILETGFPLREKGYALQTGHGATAEDAIARRQRNAVAEPVAIKLLTEKEMEYMVRETKDGRNHFDFDYFHDATKDKSACVTANTHKGVPYNVLAEPVRIGTIENDAKNQDHDSQQYRVYSPDGKSVTLCGNGGELGAKTGLYATPVDTDADGILHLGSLYGQHSRWGVFAKDGKCPTITASMGMGGGHVPMVPTRTDEEGALPKEPDDGEANLRGARRENLHRKHMVSDQAARRLLHYPQADGPRVYAPPDRAGGVRFPGEQQPSLQDAWQRLDGERDCPHYEPFYRTDGGAGGSAFYVRRYELRLYRAGQAGRRDRQLPRNRDRQVRHSDNAGELP